MSTPISNSSSSTSASNATTTSFINNLLGNSNSQTSPANTQPTISFGGLVSGLNTQSVVQAMMAADEQPLILLQNEQTYEQTKLQAWQDLQTKLQALQVATDTLSLQATTGAKQVSFSGPSGTFASGTATPDAVNGSFSLQIDQLATATKLVSTASVGQAITNSDIATLSTKLATPVTAGTFTIDQTQITVTAGDSFGTILNNIQSAMAAAGDPVNASIVGDQIQLSRPSGNTNPIYLGSGGDTSNFLSATKLLGPAAATTMTSTGPVGVANPTAILDNANINGLTSTTSGSLLINGVTINYNTATDSLNDVIGRINASAAGVTASYDAQSDTVTITSNNTGSAGISASDSAGNLLGSLNLLSAGAQQVGQSAKFEVNGGPAQYSLSNSVTNIVPGVTLTLQAATPSGQPLNVTVAQDASVGQTAIQSFVTAYNAVVDTIQKDTAYNPTTNQSGILLGDPTVEDLQQQLDSGIFIENGTSLGLPSGFTDITTIGLNTGAIGSAPGTTTDLQFDTSQFQSAMNSNPAAVTQLVTSVMGSFNKQLLDITQPFGEIDNAIQSENSLLQDLQKQINDQNDFLAQEQQALNDEFTQMETMLAEIQSQSASGAAALTSLGTSPTNTGSTPGSGSIPTTQAPATG